MVMPTRESHFLSPPAKKGLTNPPLLGIITLSFADLAHLVERHLAKVEVASSSLVIRSNKESKAFCLAFFVLQLLRDSNRATRQGSNSPGDCCGARVRAGARRSAPGESRNPPGCEYIFICPKSLRQCLRHCHLLTGARPLCRCATSPRTAGSHPLQGRHIGYKLQGSLAKGAVSAAD